MHKQLEGIIRLRKIISEVMRWKGRWIMDKKEDLDDYLHNWEVYLNRFKEYWDLYYYYVENHIYTCLVCGRPLIGSFYICNTCAKMLDLIRKNGTLKNPLLWPAWLRWLYNNERIWRGIDREPHENESYDDMNNLENIRHSHYKK